MIVLKTPGVVLTSIISVFLFFQEPAKEPASPSKSLVERGKYLITVGGCHDCHTPKIWTEKGPDLDANRLLSGHPQDEKLPDVPKDALGQGKWAALTSMSFTAWVGPWGVSFSRNLTPDVATGLGSWTEAMFIKTLRTGKHMGEGRDILPPMPWMNFAQMTNGDLEAMWAYLRSLKPISNSVPDPITPSGARIPTPNAK